MYKILINTFLLKSLNVLHIYIAFFSVIIPFIIDRKSFLLGYYFYLLFIICSRTLLNDCLLIQLEEYLNKKIPDSCFMINNRYVGLFERISDVCQTASKSHIIIACSLLFSSCFSVYKIAV